MFRSLLLAILAIAAVAPLHAQPSSQNPELHKLIADEWERNRGEGDGHGISWGT